MGHTRRTTAAALVAALVASLAGLTLAGLLAGRHAAAGGMAGLCTAGGCARILGSRYAAVGPVPTAAFGVGFYLAALAGWAAAVALSDGQARRLVVASLVALSTAAAAVSAALMVVQFAILRGFCPLCTTSAVLCLTLCALAWWLRRRTWDAQPAALALLAVPPLLALAVRTAAPAAPRAEDAVVAEVAGQPLSADRMRDDLRDALDGLAWDAYRAKVDWVERQALLVMLAKEAAAQGVTPDEVLARAVDARTHDAERSVDEWIRLHPPPPGRDPTAARAQILSRLRDDATARFVEGLKRKYAFESHLRPPEPREADLDPDHLGHRLGPDDAPARLVVFSDFRCPGCADLARAIDAARRRFGDRLSVTYLHLPLPVHPLAETAAAASECAAEAGKFWPFHDALVARGGQLDGVDLAAVAAQSAGVDRAAYDACLADGSPARARVARQARHAAALGLDATPALFLNGRRIGGTLAPAALAAEIRAVLAK